MRARSIVGVAILLVGVALVMLGFLNLNNLLFVSNITGVDNVPMYGSLVAEPMLYGLLVMFDALCVLSVRRVLAGLLYGAANVAWMLAVFDLSDALSIPATAIMRYQPVWTYFLAAFLLFVAGLIANMAGHERRASRPTRLTRIPESDEDDLRINID